MANSVLGMNIVDVMVASQREGYVVYVGSYRNSSVDGVPPFAAQQTVVVGVDGDGTVHSYHRYKTGEYIGKMGF